MYRRDRQIKSKPQKQSMKSENKFGNLFIHCWKINSILHQYYQIKRQVNHGNEELNMKNYFYLEIYGLSFGCWTKKIEEQLTIKLVKLIYQTSLITIMGLLSYQLQNIFDYYQISSMKSNTSKTYEQDLVRLSLVNNLKQNIETLKVEVEQQKKIIERYKKSTKTTLINEQQVQIQKLNDQNKRLLLIIEQLKCQNSNSNKPLKVSKYLSRGSLANINPGKKKQAPQDQQTTQDQQKITKREKNKIDYETKYYEILMQNDKMRKELTVLKANQNLMKHKKTLNQRSSILMEKSINEVDKIKKKSYELEVQLLTSEQKSSELKERVTELQELLQKALQINKSMKII